MDLRIDRANEGDLEAIYRLECVCFPTPWTVESMRRELSRRDDVAIYLAARLGDEVVGYAGMWVAAGEAHIATIGVHPQYRRRGIGQRILLRLIREAAARGSERVFLEFRPSNKAARALYAKFGFREIGIRRGYYHDTGEDGIVAALGDLQSPSLRGQMERWEQEAAARTGALDHTSGEN